MSNCQAFQDVVTQASQQLESARMLAMSNGAFAIAGRNLLVQATHQLATANAALQNCQQGLIPDTQFQPAHYVFQIDSYEINNTRSRHEDTNFVALSIVVNGGQPMSKSKEMGDQNNGHYVVGLQLDPILVDKPDATIVFNYSILNSGNAKPSDTMKKLQQASTALVMAGASYVAGEIGAAVGIVGGPIGSGLGALAGVLAGYGLGVIFADCDGLVAVEQVAFTGQQLWDQTITSHKLTRSTHQPGTDSSTGCGDNSDYTTQWSAIR